MSRDIVHENMGSYLGEQARKDWTADQGLYEVEIEIIRRHFPPPGARILDLGCGGGRTTIGLEALGYEIEAIDLSSDLVDEARKRVTRSRVQVMDARELDFADGTFAAVLFSFNGLDCVHPHDERRRVLAEVLRVLAPGAPLYYSGHNGVAAWMPRPGDTLGKLIKRNSRLLAAQRHAFSQRTRYLAYPEPGGTQVLYSALPHVHLRELREVGLAPLAVYGSRSYRRGPHLLAAHPLDQRSASLAAFLGRISVTCPHLHYVAQKLADRP